MKMLNFGNKGNFDLAASLDFYELYFRFELVLETNE